MRYVKIYNEMFHHGILVVTGCSVKECYEFVFEKFDNFDFVKKHELEKLYSTGRMHLSPYEPSVLIWCEKNPTDIESTACLIHEIQHAVYGLLKFAGIYHTDESDEVFSYYCEFVFKKCAKLMKK